MKPGAYRWSSALGTHVVAGCTCLNGVGTRGETPASEPCRVEGRVRTYSIRWPMKKGNAGNKPLVPLTRKLVVKSWPNVHEQEFRPSLIASTIPLFFDSG